MHRGDAAARTRACNDENLGVVLVTGGAGFLGSQLVAALARLGPMRCPHIHVADLARWEGGEEEEEEEEEDKEGVAAAAVAAVARTRVTSHQLDLRSTADVSALIKRVRPRCVFHVASAVDVRPLFTQALYDINVGGTTNVVVAAAACEDTKALVYCSTLDVVYSGREMNFVEETLPYTSAKTFRWWVPGNYYATTKARAEQIVLAANGEALSTAALRPGHLFGEGDVILDIFCKVPATLVQSGRMTMQYTGNAAAMHILAARRMLCERRAANGTSKSPIEVSGNAFFMGDFDVPFSDFYGRELQPTFHGYKIPVQLPIPLPLMFLIALCIDTIDFLLNLLGQLLTPFAMACRCRVRGAPLRWRFPRHPALCLSTSSVLESSENHRTNLGKGHATFGYNQFLGAVPEELGGVQFLARAESVARAQTWMKEKMTAGSKKKVNGYAYRG